MSKAIHKMMAYDRMRFFDAIRYRAQDPIAHPDAAGHLAIADLVLRYIQAVDAGMSKLAYQYLQQLRMCVYVPPSGTGESPLDAAARSARGGQG